MVEPETVHAGSGHVDGIDARQHERSGRRHVAGARDAAVEVPRHGERAVVARRIERHTRREALDVAGDVLEIVAVDIGGGENDLADAHAVGRCAAQILEDLQHRLVAHAVGDDADRLSAAPGCDQLDELSQIGLGLSGALPVVGVAREPAAGRPAIGEGGAIKLQVVGDLRRAVDGVVEARIVAVHEDEGVVLVAGRSLEAVAHQGHELVLGERLDLVHRKMAIGILGLLVERDVEDTDRPRPLDGGDLVGLGDRHQGAPERQAPATLAAIVETLQARLLGAVGAIVDWNDFPFALLALRRLGRDRRGRGGRCSAGGRRPGCGRGLGRRRRRRRCGLSCPLCEPLALSEAADAAVGCGSARELRRPTPSRGLRGTAPRGLQPIGIGVARRARFQVLVRGRGRRFGGRGRRGWRGAHLGRLPARGQCQSQRRKAWNYSTEPLQSRLPPIRRHNPPLKDRSRIPTFRRWPQKRAEA